jgi:hypothetical protein
MSVMLRSVMLRIAAAMEAVRISVAISVVVMKTPGGVEMERGAEEARRVPVPVGRISIVVAAVIAL